MLLFFTTGLAFLFLREPVGRLALGEMLNACEAVGSFLVRAGVAVVAMARGFGGRDGAARDAACL